MPGNTEMLKMYRLRLHPSHRHRHRLRLMKSLNVPTANLKKPASILTQAFLLFRKKTFYLLAGLVPGRAGDVIGDIIGVATGIAGVAGGRI